MQFDHAIEQLMAAAQKTVQRIRVDRANAPPKIKPLLQYIETHLFNPDLRIGQLKRDCDIRDNSISIQFRSALGQPPSTYIEECRMETASRLLRDSALSISLIAEVLGYSNLQVFSTAFMRWSGQRPSPYRKQFRRLEPPPRAFDEALLRVDRLRAALAGTLTQTEARALLQRLQDIYPGSPVDEPEPVADPPTASEDDEAPSPQQRADALAFYRQELRDRPFELQQSRLRQRLPERARRALFELLLEESRRVTSPEAIRRLATLALQCLDLLELDRVYADEHLLLDAAFARLKVRGWTRMAEARRRDLDFEGCEKALEIVDALLPPTTDLERRPLAELCHVKACLRWHQLRVDEAIALSSRSIPLYRLSDEPASLARAIISRATFHNGIAKHRQAIPDLYEALQLLDFRSDGRWTFEAHSQLISAYLGAGYLSEAEETLQLARRGAELCRDPLIDTMLLWLEGCMRYEKKLGEVAEALWLRARGAFSELGFPVHAAVTAIDLAQLLAHRGRATVPLEAAAEAVIPVFEALARRGLYRPAHGALLQEIADKHLRPDTLLHARRALVTLCDPDLDLRSLVVRSRRGAETTEAV